MNKFIFSGNLTRDPQTATTKNGSTACTFSVAINNNRGGENNPIYVRVTAWNKLAENCQKYLAKGRKVLVTGAVREPNAYTNKNGQAAANLEVWADEVEFLSPSGEARGQASAAEAPAFTPVESVDSLPF